MRTRPTRRAAGRASSSSSRGPRGYRGRRRPARRASPTRRPRERRVRAGFRRRAPRLRGLEPASSAAERSTQLVSRVVDGALSRGAEGDDRAARGVLPERPAAAPPLEVAPRPPLVLVVRRFAERERARFVLGEHLRDAVRDEDQPAVRVAVLGASTGEDHRARHDGVGGDAEATKRRVADGAGDGELALDARARPVSRDEPARRLDAPALGRVRGEWSRVGRTPACVGGRGRRSDDAPGVVARETRAGDASGRRDEEGARAQTPRASPRRARSRRGRRGRARRRASSRRGRPRRGPRRRGARSPRASRPARCRRRARTRRRPGASASAARRRRARGGCGRRGRPPRRRRGRRTPPPGGARRRRGSSRAGPRRRRGPPGGGGGPSRARARRTSGGGTRPRRRENAPGGAHRGTGRGRGRWTARARRGAPPRRPPPRRRPPRGSRRDASPGARGSDEAARGDELGDSAARARSRACCAA